MSQWPGTDAFKLIRSLHEHVTSTKCSYSALQIIPGAPDGEILAHESEERDALDIALSKKTYLGVFAEAHAFFEKVGYREIHVKDLTDTELWTVYYASGSILFTTNEHFTAWRVRQDVVLELLRRGNEILLDEFNFATFLAASRLKRVNKSSILFAWIRRVYVALEGESKVRELLVVRLLKSLDAHFANYCAGYTLQWLIRVLRAQGDGKTLGYLAEKLRSACRSHLSDVTLWRTYSVYLRSEDSDTYAVESFNEDLQFWGPKVANSKLLSVSLPSWDKSEDIAAELDWLLKVQCPYLTPYDCLYEAASDKPAFQETIKTAFKSMDSKPTNADPENQLKIRQLQKQRQEQAKQSPEAAAATAANPTGKVSAAQIRLQKDVTELELPSTVKIEFPDPRDLFNFRIFIRPAEGYYNGGVFSFTVEIGDNFPIDPPKIKCTQKIYHPNIDLEGNVCLNILREDWSPVLSLNSVISGLNFLFLEPNPNDPLNKAAANVLAKNTSTFARNVRSAMRGSTVDYETYDRVV
ncbi:hypothetical protein FT663_01114 [Candidozyma haemuli var. vulneris]|nr:hypothetical protein FT662_00414 [[Candida] haemuloni var. vulneris]KAF3994758.1 hypothetical protein FT663_01114 [[Candida] haemuloni var. vulneris]